MIDRVLIRPMEDKEQKKGSIIIPETAKERPQVGVIEAIGPESTCCIEDGKKVPKKKPSHDKGYTVGDKVIYAKYGATEIDHEGTKYLMVETKDLLGILKEK